MHGLPTRSAGVPGLTRPARAAARPALAPPPPRRAAAARAGARARWRALGSGERQSQRAPPRALGHRGLSTPPRAPRDGHAQKSDGRSTHKSPRRASPPAEQPTAQQRLGPRARPGPREGPGPSPRSAGRTHLRLWSGSPCRLESTRPPREKMQASRRASKKALSAGRAHGPRGPAVATRGALAPAWRERWRGAGAGGNAAGRCNGLLLVVGAIPLGSQGRLPSRPRR